MKLSNIKIGKKIVGAFTLIVLTSVIVSGVILNRWAKHPITWLRRKQIDQQRLAEFGQVISQLLKPGKLMLKPRISVGEPFSEKDLREDVGSSKLHKAVIKRVKNQYL